MAVCIFPKFERRDGMRQEKALGGGYGVDEVHIHANYGRDNHVVIGVLPVRRPWLVVWNDGSMLGRKV